MSQFLKTKTEKKAKSVDEAVQAALEELQISEDDAQITVIDEGTKGFLGIGAKDAEVEVSIKNVDSFMASRFLNDVFQAMNMDVEIDTKETEDGLDINLTGDHMGIVIGKRGDTLDSLQYLTALVVNRNKEDYTKISIDTENYRKKREEALLALSTRLGAKVAKSGKKYTLEPMNPYERRIIHANLQNNEEVTTYSVGEEPYRKVVIAPKAEKAQNKKFKRNNNHHGGHKKPSYSAGGYSAPDRKISTGGYKQPHVYNKNKASSFEEYLSEQENKNSGNDAE